MKALVFDMPGSMRFEHRDLPKAGPGEVVIKTAAVGLCGTDIHLFDGEFEGAGFPMVPGHEASGWIHDVGDGVSGFSPGQPVVINPNVMCGTCEFCQDGRTNLCTDWDGRGVMKTDGCAQEYFVAPAQNTYALRDTTDVYAASLIEPLACVVHAFDRLPRRLGDHFLIYGAGTMGLLVAQLAPRAGGASVTIVDTAEERRAAARDVGVTNVVSNASDADRDHFEIVIDCTGNSKAISDGLAHLKRGGTFLQVGVTAESASIEVSPFRVYRDELTVAGSLIVEASFRRAVEMFEAGVINHAAMVSHSFPLDSFEDALKQFRSGSGRKLQIRPHDHDTRQFL